MHFTMFAAMLLLFVSPIDPISDRIRTEAPPAWNSLRTPWSGEYLRKSTTEFDTQRIEIECRIKAGPQGHLLCESRRGAITKVEATNPRYNFSVSRAETESKYVLASGSPNNADVNPYRVVTRAGFPFFASSYLFGYPLEDILLDEQMFPWKDASTLKNGMIEVWFTSNSPEPMFSGEGAEFRVVLNPQMSWRVETFEMLNFGGTPGRRSEFTVEYESGRESRSPGTVARVKEKRTLTDQVEWETIEIIDRVEREVDSDEFTLPFYGLSDAVFFPRSSWLKSQWILLAFGLVMLGSGFWLWKKQ